MASSASSAAWGSRVLSLSKRRYPLSRIPKPGVRRPRLAPRGPPRRTRSGGSAGVPLGQTTTRLSVGSRARRSSGSLVTTDVLARRAHTTTCASAMSPDARGVDAVEGCYLSSGLTQEPCEAGLPCGVANGSRPDQADSSLPPLRHRTNCGTVVCVATTRPVAQAVKAAQEVLSQVDPAKPSEALPLLREASERLTEAIDAAMAAVLLEEGGTIRQAGTLAGLSENAVGPRLARTDSLAAYTSDAGRVTAKGVERALYDIELGRHQIADKDKPRKPLRFRARRPSSD